MSKNTGNEIVKAEEVDVCRMVGACGFADLGTEITAVERKPGLFDGVAKRAAALRSELAAGLASAKRVLKEKKKKEKPVFAGEKTCVDFGCGAVVAEAERKEKVIGERDHVAKSRHIEGAAEHTCVESYLK